MNAKIIGASIVVLLAVGGLGFLVLRDDTTPKGPDSPGVVGSPTAPPRDPGIKKPLVPSTPSDTPRGVGGAGSTTPTRTPTQNPTTPAAGSTPSSSQPLSGTLAQLPPGSPSGLASAIVLDGKSAPVAGAEVEFTSAGGSLLGRAWTDQTGKATSDRANGDVLVRARHPRFGQPATGHVKPGFEVTLRFAEGPDGGSQIMGYVHDPDGPVKDPVVHLQDENSVETSVSGAGLQLDGIGNFKIDVTPGKYTVWVTAKGWADSDKSYATANAGSPFQGMDFLLFKCGRLAGKVALPPDLANGRDMPDVCFSLECVTGTKENPRTTPREVTLHLDPGGMFVIDDCEAGQYRIRAALANDPSRVGTWVNCQLNPGGRLDGLVLPVEGGKISVIGLVRDPGGQPVEGATVTIPGTTIKMSTDRQGRFEVYELDPGKRDIYAEKQGFVRGRAQVEVDSGQSSPIGVQITLEQQAAIDGLVTRGGKPAPGVAVLVVKRAVGGGMKPFPLLQSDGQGRFRLDGLEPGSYVVKTGEAANDPWSEKGAPVDVRSGMPASVTVTVP